MTALLPSVEHYVSLTSLIGSTSESRVLFDNLIRIRQSDWLRFFSQETVPSGDLGNMITEQSPRGNDEIAIQRDEYVQSNNSLRPLERNLNKSIGARTNPSTSTMWVFISMREDNFARGASCHLKLSGRYTPPFRLS